MIAPCTESEDVEADALSAARAAPARRRTRKRGLARVIPSLRCLSCSDYKPAGQQCPAIGYVHPSQTRAFRSGKLVRMTPQALAAALEQFLSGSSNAVVIEDGAVCFDLTESKYSVSGENNKCLLHLWSSERNVVRRVLEVESQGATLRVMVQRIGQPKPTRLEICRERDRRSPSAKRAARAGYQRVLERVLRKRFPDFTVARLSSSMDLEKSFGPIYARGLMRRGRSAFAVLGVSSQELQPSIDASLTFGILWLDVCRQANAGKLVVEGLRLFVPQGRSELVRERISQLNSDIAKWQLYELNERTDELSLVEIPDRGNISTRLIRCADESAVKVRFAEPISLVKTVMPE